MKSRQGFSVFGFDLRERITSAGRIVMQVFGLHKLDKLTKIKFILNLKRMFSKPNLLVDENDIQLYFLLITIEEQSVKNAHQIVLDHLLMLS
jgi:hypothetical protein